MKFIVPPTHTVTKLSNGFAGRTIFNDCVIEVSGIEPSPLRVGHKLKEFVLDGYKVNGILPLNVVLIDKLTDTIHISCAVDYFEVRFPSH
jgi:hypothetical protein